jgi:hypothetical protein
MTFDAASLTTYRCSGCGYGASCRHEPERCPMCGDAAWETLVRVPRDVTFDLVAAARRAAARAGADADAPLVRELVEVSVFPGVPLS